MSLPDVGIDLKLWLDILYNYHLVKPEQVFKVFISNAKIKLFFTVINSICKYLKYKQAYLHNKNIYSVWVLHFRAR